MSDIVIITRFPADFNVLGDIWIELSQSKRPPLKNVRPCTFLGFEFCLTAKRRKYGTTAIRGGVLRAAQGRAVVSACAVSAGLPKLAAQSMQSRPSALQTLDSLSLCGIPAEPVHCVLPNGFYIIQRNL